jgi:hypothetical protein
MKESCLSALGFPERVEKIQGGPAGKGEMGEGGETWMGKTEGNYITLDLSNSSERNRQGQ